MRHRWLFALAAGATLMAQTPPAATPASRIGELERLGEGGRELMILGVDAPGFDRLKPPQRVFAYYMYRAALAGNEIYYMQNHRAAWEIKELLETIYAHRQGLDPAIAEGLEEYLKLVWANHGQYHHWNHAKFVPRKLSFQQLQKAVKVAKKNGAKFAVKAGEPVERTLVRLKPHIFDPKVEPLQVQTSGEDVIRASASGYYDPGLRLADIQALPKEAQAQVNVRFAAAKKAKKGAPKAEPQVFKVGGVYGEQLQLVVYWLKKALPWVENERVEVEREGKKRLVSQPSAVQKKALEDLIAFFETGDEARFRDHSIGWLKINSAIDYLNGFYEVYKDPRAIIGSYQANVSFRVDSEKLDKLSRNAMYFEARMPWKEAWRRAKVEPPVAISVNVLVETGDGGPLSAAAYNLPNYDEIRRAHGSKNVMLQNVELAQSPEIKEKTAKAFYLPEYQELMAKYGDLGRQWMVYLHEVIGHGSGQADESLKGEEPALRIGGTYNALEECRADAVALYQFMDPKLVEIGVVSAEDHEAAAQAMFISTLTRQLRTIGEVEGDVVRQAHERAEYAILNWLIQSGKDFGTAVVQRDGNHFLEISDVRKAREGVGQLLEKLQTMKAMGDKAAVDAFFDEMGTKVNKEWQKSARTRLEALNRPKETALVFPKLVPVMAPARFGKPDAEGKVRQDLVDARMECSETFAEQMMRFRTWGRTRDIVPQ